MATLANVKIGFTDTELKFDVVVTESNSQHLFWAWRLVIHEIVPKVWYTMILVYIFSMKNNIYSYKIKPLIPKSFMENWIIKL